VPAQNSVAHGVERPAPKSRWHRPATNSPRDPSISRAALFGNVSSRMLGGSIPVSSRYATRYVTVRVLPEPAPARPKADRAVRSPQPTAARLTLQRNRCESMSVSVRVVMCTDETCDDCGLKRTAARRRLQIHRDCQSRSLVAKATHGRVALPKLSRNNPASRIDFARSAFGVRVRSRTAFGQLVPRRKRTHSLEPLRRSNVLTDHLGLPITAAAAEWGAAEPHTE
jgi:hypothetical protein